MSLFQPRAIWFVLFPVRYLALFIVVLTWMTPITTLHGRSFAVYSAANSVTAYNFVIWSGLSWYSVLIYQLVEERCCCWRCQLPWGTSQNHDIYCVQWDPSAPNQYISVHRQRSTSKSICSRDKVVSLNRNRLQLVFVWCRHSCGCAGTAAGVGDVVITPVYLHSLPLLSTSL